MKTQGRTQEACSESMEIDSRYFRKLISENFVNIRLKTLIKIANGMNVSLLDLFSDNILSKTKKEKNNIEFYLHKLSIRLKKRRKLKKQTQKEFSSNLGISLREYILIEKCILESPDVIPNLQLITILMLSEKLEITIEALFD